MRIYIFLRKDLSNPQKVVQSSHLSLESCHKFGMPITGHPSIIVLKINRADLELINTFLDKKNIKSVSFFENDISDFTGIATEPLTIEQSKQLSQFKLLTLKDF
jgi:hypothetical protein